MEVGQARPLFQRDIMQSTLTGPDRTMEAVSRLPRSNHIAFIHDGALCLWGGYQVIVCSTFAGVPGCSSLFTAASFPVLNQGAVLTVVSLSWRQTSLQVRNQSLT